MGWRNGAAATHEVLVVRGGSVGGCDDQPAYPDIDHLTGGDSAGGVQLGPVHPRPAHAPKIAQPVGALPVRDPRMATRDREVLEPDRVLRATTYGRAGSCDLERRSRPTLGL